MTVSRWTAAGALAGAVLVGLLVGRYATPAKVIERDKIVTTDRDTELTWHAYVGHTETRTAEKVAWRTVTEWKPGGATVQTVYVDRAAEASSTTATAANSATASERVVTRVEERERIVEAKRQDWLVGARAGLRFDDWQPVYGGEVARRIVGPFHVGAWVQASSLSREGTAGGVVLSVLF